MLARDPKQRPTAAQVEERLDDALFRFARGQAALWDESLRGRRRGVGSWLELLFNMAMDMGLD
jgi:hypothetical protein